MIDFAYFASFFKKLPLFSLKAYSRLLWLFLSFSFVIVIFLMCLNYPQISLLSIYFITLSLSFFFLIDFVSYQFKQDIYDFIEWFLIPLSVIAFTDLIMFHEHDDEDFDEFGYPYVTTEDYSNVLFEGRFSNYLDNLWSYSNERDLFHDISYSGSYDIFHSSPIGLNETYRYGHESSAKLSVSQGPHSETASLLYDSLIRPAYYDWSEPGLIRALNQMILNQVEVPGKPGTFIIKNPDLDVINEKRDEILEKKRLGTYDYGKE